MENNSKTVLVIVVGLALLSIFFDIKILNTIALVIGGLSILSSKLENLIVYLWGKIALILGWINTKIILSLVFYIFLTPFAILAKIFSKNDLQLKNPKKTTFVVRNHKYTKKDLENIW